MHVQVYDDAEAVAGAAAAAVSGWLSEAAGRVTIGLAGGGTPIATYRRLREEEIMWDSVDAWLGDERWVPRHDPDSNALMGDDHRTHLGKYCVAADVIIVHVRVYQETDGGIRYRSNGRHNLIAERRELIVNENDAVLTDRHADVPALASDLVDAASNVMDCDVDRVPRGAPTQLKIEWCLQAFVERLQILLCGRWRRAE